MIFFLKTKKISKRKKSKAKEKNTFFGYKKGPSFKRMFDAKFALFAFLFQSVNWKIHKPFVKTVDKVAMESVLRDKYFINL